MTNRKGGWVPALIATAIGVPIMALIVTMKDGQSESAVETERERMLRTVEEQEDALTHRWVPPRRNECGAFAEKCSVLEVVAPRGCVRGLYVAVSAYDADGRNVGWTNDTAKGVAPGETVRLAFNIREADAETARVAEMICR